MCHAHHAEDCGSCWTFASTAAIESAFLISGEGGDKWTADNVDLSEQQFVRCGREGEKG